MLSQNLNELFVGFINQIFVSYFSYYDLVFYETFFLDGNRCFIY